MPNEQDILKRRQALGAEVEGKMVAFLMQYSPARELKVCDVLAIAASARTYAFDASEIVATVA